MNKIAVGDGALKLPTPEEPLPAYLGKPGLLQLRQLIKQSWGSSRQTLTAEQSAVVREMIEVLRLTLVPAKPAEIGQMVGDLMWHYPAVSRPPEAASSVAADWIRDLGHLPRDIVDAACSGWRRGPNSFAPAPGHLLAIADPILVARRHLLTLAERLIVPAESVKAAMRGRS